MAAGLSTILEAKQSFNWVYRLSATLDHAANEGFWPARKRMGCRLEPGARNGVHGLTAKPASGS
jgi:hypothetical protein